MGKGEKPFMPHGPACHKFQSGLKQPLPNALVPVVRPDRQGSKERNTAPSCSEVGANEFIFYVSSESRRRISCPASPYVICVAREFYRIGKIQKSPKGDAEDPIRF